MNQSRSSLVSKKQAVVDYAVETQQESTFTTESKDDDVRFIVQFTPRDPRNPMNFHKSKKWLITFVASIFTLVASMSATSFSFGQNSMSRELESTTFQATLGLSLFCLGFAVLPLVTSSFSEEFGRTPLYYASIIGFMLMHLMAAMSQNIQAVVISRFIQGACASTGGTMVAGTVADIWAPHERGGPMSLYAFIAFAGNGIGAVFGGWTEMNSRLEWRWIQWISLIIAGAYFLLMVAVIDETRTTVILRKIAKKMRKQTGDERYRPYVAPGQETSLARMIYVSCTRPVYMLLLEPVVFSVSLWVGFAWGVYYCMIQSIPRVFRDLHGFNEGQIGTVYLTLVVGSMLGLITNIYQERLYQKTVSTRGVQARLYIACVAGFIFPASMFMFAWSSVPSVPWAVLVVSLIIYVWATFAIYLAVFTYLADCYGIYASSALASQSLFRNLMATIFPLFADQMFSALGYRWSNSMFAFVALTMSPLPIVLLFYGSRILARSRLVSSPPASPNAEKNSAA